MADLDVQAGRLSDATAHLHEAAQVSLKTQNQFAALNVLYSCAFLCAATGRHAEAVTVWAAYLALGHVELLADARRWEEPLRAARQALRPGQVRAARQRGAAMTLATATEYALMLTGSTPARQTEAGTGKLSARERELVTLVAQGATNAQITAQLYISIRTVSSHLDRIRDKTGCRRRADLTRLTIFNGWGYEVG